jgi:hypothetical protein
MPQAYTNQPLYYNPRAHIPANGPPMNMGMMQPPAYTPHLQGHNSYSHPQAPTQNYNPYYNNPPPSSYRGYSGYGVPPPPQGMYMNPPMSKPMMAGYNPNIGMQTYSDPTSNQFDMY